MSKNQPSNDQIASILDQIADLLEIKDANPFRVQAYRDAANTVQETEKSIAEIVFQSGEEALTEMPNIGEGIASIISSYVKTGRSEMLDRLQGEIEPSDLFKKVPGIGEKLAQRIGDELDITSLEELEQAAHDSRLGEVPGFGPKKVRNIRVSLAGMLSAAAQRSIQQQKRKEAGKEQPSVATLLEVDKTYRQKAEKGELRKIAPKRFNPEGKAWLPILNTKQDGWTFTALYSNTARAHDLHKTHDWVVLYFEKDGQEDQATVVTETKGPLEGKRVVRGREQECQEYYQNN